MRDSRLSKDRAAVAAPDRRAAAVAVVSARVVAVVVARRVAAAVAVASAPAAAAAVGCRVAAVVAVVSAPVAAVVARRVVAVVAAVSAPAAVAAAAARSLAAVRADDSFCIEVLKLWAPPASRPPSFFYVPIQLQPLRLRGRVLSALTNSTRTQDSGRSTQHPAPSTQHSAPSTQHLTSVRRRFATPPEVREGAALRRFREMARAPARRTPTTNRLHRPEAA
jgi:hypothetical protein